MNWIRWQYGKLKKWVRSWRMWKKLDAQQVVETYTVPLGPTGEYQYSHTKKYADQRQKAPHNRKRKPSKAMQNIYQLK